ncbi:MAG TPA: ATPase, T2SS/T4P/T4SS family, partial [Acidimicrobiales bacterium]|nr:ATPase, T2SS/T4P/T4SS family [Acidimicrobiales bacterium]
MLRRGKDTPAPSAGAGNHFARSDGVARTGAPLPQPAADDFDLDAELAIVSAESRYTPEPALAWPEVNHVPESPARAAPTPTVTYAPPVAPQPPMPSRRQPEPPPETRRTRRPLRARRGGESDNTPPLAARPTYPSGQPATAGGHLLGALLVSQELVTQTQLDKALADQPTSGLRLGEVLIRMGALDERQLTRVLANQFGIGLADLSQQAPDPQVAGRLSEAVAREYKALPLRDVDGVVEVVVGDPQPGMESVIQQALGGPVQLFAVTPTAARQAIDRAYRALADVDRMVKAFESSDAPRLSSTTARDEAIGSDSPVAKVVTMLVTEALRDRASDIHLEPSDNQLRVRFRIDGALHDVLSLPMNMSGALVSRIKILANMNIVERRKAQDGQFATDVDGRGIDV